MWWLKLYTSVILEIIVHQCSGALRYEQVVGSMTLTVSSVPLIERLRGRGGAIQHHGQHRSSQRGSVILQCFPV